MNKNLRAFKDALIISLYAGLTAFMSVACNSKASDVEHKLLTLPVYQTDTATAVTVKNYLGTIEGKVNVEIRPQVEGILETIYVDEGSYVKEGQSLFKINASPYQEALKNAVAAERVEKAKEENAQLEVESLKPLVENEVISDIQLRTAQSNKEVASASVAKAAAAVATARINLDFTNIKAPTSGYIGRIPKRIGNLVSKGDSQPLTVLSDTREVYVYFAMSESDFLHFIKKGRGNDSAGIQNNISLIPHVRLILADGSEYPELGIVDAVDGRVNSTTGAISLRASFPNPDNILRHGNTGTLKVEELQPGSLLIPQVAVLELQDIQYVYVVREDNSLKMQAIEINGTSGNYYIVTKGLKPKDKVVTAGLDKLEEGLIIDPKLQNL